jgi:hypothetical protein
MNRAEIEMIMKAENKDLYTPRTFGLSKID